MNNLYPLDPPGYAERVSELEREGMTTSDAQGVADAEFVLRNAPAGRKKTNFGDQEHRLQKKLIDGLDCLPGQQDLF